jgi:hypothetical protein
VEFPVSPGTIIAPAAPPTAATKKKTRAKIATRSIAVALLKAAKSSISTSDATFCSNIASAPEVAPDIDDGQEKSMEPAVTAKIGNHQ